MKPIRLYYKGLLKASHASEHASHSVRSNNGCLWPEYNLESLNNPLSPNGSHFFPYFIAFHILMCDFTSYMQNSICFF